MIHVGRLWRGFLGVGVLLLLPGLVAACELSLGWEPWEPYQFKDDKGELKGLDVELMQLIMERMECRLAFSEMPWKRHLKEVEAGSIDLAAGADRTPEREAYARFSEPYRKETVQLFVRRDEVGEYGLESQSRPENFNDALEAVRGSEAYEDIMSRYTEL